MKKVALNLLTNDSFSDLLEFLFLLKTSEDKKLNCQKKLRYSKNQVLFVCVGVLRPSQQQGHVEPVS